VSVLSVQCLPRESYQLDVRHRSVVYVHRGEGPPLIVLCVCMCVCVCVRVCVGVDVCACVCVCVI
jgi:hypothetical protein